MCSVAIPTALGAKPKPITMITEPTTTGGKILLIHFVPINLIINAIATYTAPTITSPPITAP